MFYEDLIHTLGRKLYEVTLPFWPEGQADQLNQAIASFLLHLLSCNQKRLQRPLSAEVLHLVEIEKRHVLAVCDQCRTRKEAAEALGIDRSKLYRLLRMYGVDPAFRRVHTK